MTQNYDESAIQAREDRAKVLEGLAATKPNKKTKAVEPFVGPPKLSFEDVSDFLQYTEKRQERKRIFGDFGETGGLILLAAPPKSSKSALAMELAIHAAHGSSYHSTLQNEAGPLKVCYADAEMDAADYVSRYGRRSDEIQGHVHFLSHGRILEWRRAKVDVLERIVTEVNTAGMEFVVIDNASTVFRKVSDPESADEQLDVLLHDIFKHYERTGKWRTYLVIMHQNTGQRRKAQDAGEINRPLQDSDLGGASNFTRRNRTLWVVQNHPTVKSQSVWRHLTSRGSEADPDWCMVLTRSYKSGAVEVYPEGGCHVGDIWKQEGAHRNHPKSPTKDSELQLLRTAVNQCEGAGTNSKTRIFEAYQALGGKFGLSWAKAAMDTL